MPEFLHYNCYIAKMGKEGVYGPREFPTKGNLMLAKNSLALANQGYELMDKKRNILLKELMGLIDEAKGIQEEIDSTFTQAYACLQAR